MWLKYSRNIGLCCNYITCVLCQFDPACAASCLFVCPSLSALGEVIHSSNDWSGCRLPSNTEVPKGFQISEAYSYLLFSLSLSLLLIEGAFAF